MRWCTCTCVVVFIYLWFFLLQTSASRSAARHSQLKVVFVCTRRTVLERRRCHVGCCGAVVKGCYRVEVTAIRIRVREVGFGGASDGASEMLTRDGTPLPRLHLFRAGRIVHPVRTWGCGAVGLLGANSASISCIGGGGSTAPDAPLARPTALTLFTLHLRPPPRSR